MDSANVYDDVQHVDLGSEISKLEEQNKFLLNHINKLEDDVKKLCTELVNMKEIQKNLSRNISELFKTAKIEIQRKDRTIAELRQEIDDLILNRGGNFNRYKRQLHEKEADDHTKRFKSNVYDNEHKSVREKSPIKLTSTSSSDSNRGEVRDAQHEDANRTIRNHKTNHFNRNSRYPLSSGNSRYQRRDTRYNENRNGRDRSRTRRSRSFDRSRSKDKRRSRSGDKYHSSISRPRWKENKTSECRTYNDRISKSIERRYEYSERSPFRKDRDLYYNEGNVSNLTKDNLNTGYLDIINLDDEIEDGEITAESDALIIEDYYVEPKSFDAQQSNMLTNKVDTKPITIEEYRNRRRDVECETRVIDSKIVNDKEVDGRGEQIMWNANNKESEIQKEAEEAESIAVAVLDIASNVNGHIKTTDCNNTIADDVNKSDAVLNNLSNNAISLNNEGSNSINSDNCNISCGENNSILSNSSNVSITPTNNTRRPRKRRCVVIGFKEKA